MVDQKTIKELITRNMERAGLMVDGIEVFLIEDPYGGWRLAVVCDGFEGLGFVERRQIALQGTDGDQFEWTDLLTHEESDLMGMDFTEPVVEDLPLWAEALARKAPDSGVVFASDLDTDVEEPIIVTFYSVKGGVGRSTALAHTGRILAQSGLTVFCVDMDLEAPGLACLFGKENEIKPHTGVLKVLAELDQGEKPNLPEHVIRISDSYELYLLSAGVPDADYARRLKLVDPESWYRESTSPLTELMDTIKMFSPKPEVVLIDSRTGLSPVSAPLLFNLCDLAVITFFPHPQAQTVTGLLTQALVRARSRREVDGCRLTPEPRFLVSLVPAKALTEYRGRAREWVDDWLAPLNDQRDERLRIDSRDVLHVIEYQESLALADTVLESGEALRVFEPVADWVRKFIPTPSEREENQDLVARKETILNELRFVAVADTATAQEEPVSTFVSTEVFRKAMKPNHPVVVGRKGTGKTALFRWLLAQRPSVVGMCPSAIRDTYPWVLSPEGFGGIAGAVAGAWREFWILFTAVSCYHNLRQSGCDPVGPPSQLADIGLDRDIPHMTEWVERLKRALAAPNAGLVAWEWLRNLDLTLTREYLILFDGLDTGFGNSDSERCRRRTSLEGLFSLIVDREGQLRNLRFKTLIRDDIWGGLTFDNKSHLLHTLVRLEWRDRFDYVRTVLKRAILSPGFARVTQDVTGFKASGLQESIDSWPEQVVQTVWNLLVGERMKGAKSTYTLNWVWNRLADAQDNRSPRSLLELFEQARQCEIREQRTTRYTQSVIRPRVLTHALPAVSTNAVESLFEEFPELRDFTEELHRIGRVPLDIGDLESEPVDLALAAGLLGRYDKGVDGKERRYTIPDLYLSGLGMRRKGQA